MNPSKIVSILLVMSLIVSICISLLMLWIDSSENDIWSFVFMAMSLAFLLVLFIVRLLHGPEVHGPMKWAELIVGYIFTFILIVACIVFIWIGIIDNTDIVQKESNIVNIKIILIVTLLVSFFTFIGIFNWNKNTGTITSSTATSTITTTPKPPLVNQDGLMQLNYGQRTVRKKN